MALTGAGISVPSGIPDFRSPGTGLWANVDPMEVAHIDVFRRDPERFWHFYGHRFARSATSGPNGAHRALVELERRGIVEAVVTQNIDGLHRAAGHARPDRGPRHDRHVVVPGVRRRATSWPRCGGGWTRRPTACRAATAGGR